MTTGERYMSATVKIKNLPALVFADDYHEFVDLNEQFHSIGLSLKTEELGFAENEGSYVGIVYSGRYPSKAKIEALLKKFGVELG
jgi:phage anti-repressor protein